jgi:hypothetical protein
MSIQNRICDNCNKQINKGDGFNLNHLVSMIYDKNWYNNSYDFCDMGCLKAWIKKCEEHDDFMGK